MKKSLDIYWDNKFVGQLIQTPHGDLNFQYSDTWLHDINSRSISCSLPLQNKIFTRKECQGFFPRNIT